MYMCIGDKIIVSRVTILICDRKIVESFSSQRLQGKSLSIERFPLNFLFKDHVISNRREKTLKYFTFIKEGLSVTIEITLVTERTKHLTHVVEDFPRQLIRQFCSGCICTMWQKQY